MNEKIQNIAYECGLYSQGTPDSWDEAALEQFALQIIQRCCHIVEDAVDHREPASTYVAKIKGYFNFTS